MNVSEVIKTSLKYPQKNFKNAVILAAFLILFSFLSFLGYYRLFSVDALMGTENSATLANAVTNYAGAVSATDWLVFLISLICSIVVLIIINGYVYRVYEGSEDLPEFDNFKLLLLQGIKVIAVSIVYYIVPVVVLAIGFCFSYVLVVVGAILLFVVQFFIQPMAVAEMAKNDDLKLSFKIKQILITIKEIGLVKYLGSIIFSFIVQLVICLAFGMLFTLVMLIAIAIPVIGMLFAVVFFVLAFIVYSYLMIFSIKIFEVLYNQKKVI